MHKREELEKILDYRTVNELILKDSNYQHIQNLVGNEFVDYIRSEVIFAVMKKENKESKKVKSVIGYAKGLVQKKIYQKIEEDRQYNAFQTNVGWIEGIYSSSNDPSEEMNDIEYDQIILDCLNALNEKEGRMVVMRIVHGIGIPEIAKELNIDPNTISSKIYSVFRKMKTQLKRICGPDFEVKERDTLHDISVPQENIDINREWVFSSQETNPGIDEEDKEHMNKEYMSKEYMDMLFHTVYDVAEIQPISDMMDDYLFGKLKGEQKKLLEKHLMKCNKCCGKLKERKTIIGGIKRVMKDIEE